MIQALAAQRPDDPLRDRICPRGADRGEQGLDAKAFGPLHEVAAVDGVPVAQQGARLPAPGGGLDELPPGPRGGRVGGDVAVHQFPSVLGAEQQAVQRPEGQSLDGEASGRPDLRAMVGQAGPPRLARTS
jgi:hypothetical protein